MTAAQKELDGYINRLIDQQSGSSRGGLIGDLVSDHEQEDRLDRDELVAMVEAVLLAGTDTTRNQLGATLAVLGDHPEQYAALRHDRTLIPAAIEESLRYIGAVRSTARLASRDLVVDGVLFPAGTTVLIGLHAAGLSEAGESDGYRFEINRSQSCPHLAFGSGAHHCLGAFLVRADGENRVLGSDRFAGSSSHEFSTIGVFDPPSTAIPIFIPWQPLSSKFQHSGLSALSPGSHSPWGSGDHHA